MSTMKKTQNYNLFLYKFLSKPLLLRPISEDEDFYKEEFSEMEDEFYEYEGEEEFDEMDDEMYSEDDDDDEEKVRLN